MTDLYEHLAESFGRIASYAAFGGVVGTVAAVLHKDHVPSSKASYGEWAAYSAALSGVFSIAFELARSI